jgi:hypothetical protein
MSETFTATAKAMSDDPDLRAKVMSAGSAEERAGILRDAGVDIPSHADVNSGYANLSDVSGAGGTGTVAAVVGAASAAGA